VSPAGRIRACEDALALFSLSLDEEPSPLERRKLDRHLLSCAECRRRAAAIDAVTVALRGLPPEVPAGSSVPSTPRRHRIARTGIPAAAAVAMASLGLVALQGSVSGNMPTATVTVPDTSTPSSATYTPGYRAGDLPYPTSLAWAP
jgi:predicted anti-sigma-YlaC factor YlaD